MFDVEKVCREAKEAANLFSSVSEEKKNELLTAIKNSVWDNRKAIMAINAQDVEEAEKNGIPSALIDRLTLNEQRIETMCKGIDDIVALPDYVGKVEEEYTLKNGLQVKKVHAPLGVVGIIYEARPNVTVDAAALCVKSGNAVILKGGKEAIHTNRFLAMLMKQAFFSVGLRDELIGFIDGTERELTAKMLSLGEYIDVVIPRGGEKLKKYVLSAATMPVIASSGGNCHVYVEKTADQEMALNIVQNAKLSRPSVCNACETLLVDREIADDFLPKCLTMLSEQGVEIRGKEEIKPYFEKVVLVDDDEFYVEYIDKKIKVKIVGGVDEAIDHINRYNTKHSEAIVTKDPAAAEKFTKTVDAGCVYVNASTRFTDGFELGLGAEMGISTQKLHVRGPIGLKELTSVKYVVTGSGQIR